MAWTVTFGGAVGGRFTLTASDGSTKYVREFTSTAVEDATVKAAARAFVAELTAQSVAAGKLTILPAGAVDLTLDVPVVPVDPDPARTAFLADYRRLQALKRAIDIGLLPLDVTYTNLRVKVTAAYLPAYEGLL